MKRTIKVATDRSTWPSGAIIPQSFPKRVQQFDLHMPGLFLAIGFLTTPSHSSGISLSDFWAWVRYFHAFSDDNDLRLTQEFSELDPHQKTILSDDFGMGVPMYWLYDHLQLGLVADGYYFMRRLAPRYGAITASPARRGPGKSPDFVAQDAGGRWHVIECKGTQSGSSTRRKQLFGSGARPDGGVAQKNTITFPPGIARQRLACGLCIAFENSRDESSLKIVDPVEPKAIQLLEDHMRYADDTLIRGVGGRSLWLAGFHATSSALSAPSGATPDVAPEADGRRETVASDKADRASAELEGRGERESWEIAGQAYFGRRVEIELPPPLGIKRPIRRVLLRFGVSARFLEHQQVRAKERRMEEFQESSLWREGGTVFETDGPRTEMRVGSLFVAKIEIDR